MLILFIGSNKKETFTGIVLVTFVNFAHGLLHMDDEICLLNGKT